MLSQYWYHDDVYKWPFREVEEPYGYYDCIAEESELLEEGTAYEFSRMVVMYDKDAYTYFGWHQFRTESYARDDNEMFDCAEENF